MLTIDLFSHRRIPGYPRESLKRMPDAWHCLRLMKKLPGWWWIPTKSNEWMKIILIRFHEWVKHEKTKGISPNSFKMMDYPSEFWRIHKSSLEERDSINGRDINNEMNPRESLRVSTRAELPCWWRPSILLPPLSMYGRGCRPLFDTIKNRVIISSYARL